MRTREKITSFFLVILAVNFLTSCSDIESELAKPKFVVPAEPKSFEDMLENPKSIVYWAWKKSADQIINNISATAKFTVEVGPNTTADNTNPDGGINLASRLYLDFEKQIPTKFVYFEHKDVDWAQSKVNEFHGRNIQGWQKNEANKMCPSEDQCRGASAMTSFDKKKCISNCKFKPNR
jgi:hypothetical protein